MTEKNYITKKELERYEKIIENYEDVNTIIKLNEFKYLQEMVIRLSKFLFAEDSVTNKKIGSNLARRLFNIYDKKGFIKWKNDPKTPKNPINDSTNKNKIFKEAIN